MNLRFWEWDRVFNLVVIACLLAVAASTVLMTVPYVIGTDADGNEVVGTIWQGMSLLQALLLVGLPVLITASPLTVLSRAGGVGRQQLINLWTSVALLGVFTAVIEVFYLPAAIFMLSASVAGTVRRKSTAIGRTASGRRGIENRGRNTGIRLSKGSRGRDRRDGGDR